MRGKLNLLEKDGFTFDLGPSILTMPHIFRALFDRAGKRMDDYVQFQEVIPIGETFSKTARCSILPPTFAKWRKN